MFGAEGPIFLKFYIGTVTVARMELLGLFSYSNFGHLISSISHPQACHGVPMVCFRPLKILHCRSYSYAED